MAIPGLFRTPSAKKFNYRPLYWDADKEARDQRVRAIKQEMGVEVELGKKSSAITRGSFRHTSSSKTKSNASRCTTWRPAAL